MPDQKRKYTFKNQEYWTKARAPRTDNGIKMHVQDANDKNAWEPTSIALASTAYSGGGQGGTSNVGRSGAGRSGARNAVSDSMNNLRDLKMPYFEKNGRISIRDAIILCQKVYANIAIFRNTIDIMSEFSCADIYLTGGNAASKTFVKNWLDKINVDKLCEQFFREFYMSGNVFIFVYDGIFSDEDFKKLKVATAAAKNKIPIRYTILNPADIVIFPAAAFEMAPYRKVLNDYELEAIKARKTDEDKALYKALPDDIKKLIDNKSWNSDGIWMPISIDKLYPIFYKKQPYQPFSVPFGYPVLRDLNHKEELKKIDQAIARTIDNVILLVTMGEKKDTEGNGMNPLAMQKMQELLQTDSIGRVLVSDYTTKMQFIIPEIGDILNPLKYQVVNQDIKEGLLNILASDDKFGNAVMKSSIFLERLKEGRKAFLKEFLQREINKVCKGLGFKSVPVANFQEIDLKDEVQFSKIYTRLMEIGVLTPEQGMKVMQTGIFPEPEELKPSQTEYHKERQDGLWNPLVGGMPQVTSAEGDANRDVQVQLGEAKMANDAKIKGAGGANPNATDNGRPSGSSGTPKSSSTPSPAGTSKASLIELSKTKHLVSLKKLKSVAQQVSDLINTAERKIKEQYKLTELNQKQQDLVYRLAGNVMSTTKAEEWNTQLEAVLKEPEKYLTSYASNEISSAVEGLAAEHGVDSYSASILYHSKWQQ